MNRVLGMLAVVVLLLGLVGTANAAPVVWTGPNITFTKFSYADWTDSANQDRITDSTWLTRKDKEGLFNIVSEAGYNHNVSPANTEWAYGSATDWASLDFEVWEVWAEEEPPSIVEQDAVVHLIQEDIYLDIKFHWWNSSAYGGGFMYERSTVPIPGAVWLLGSGLVALVGLSRKFAN